MKAWCCWGNLSDVVTHGGNAFVCVVWFNEFKERSEITNSNRFLSFFHILKKVSLLNKSTVRKPNLLIMIVAPWAASVLVWNA